MRINRHVHTLKYQVKNEINIDRIEYHHELTPKAIACAIPNFGTFLAHNGLKCSVRQIFPPL